MALARWVCASDSFCSSSMAAWQDIATSAHSLKAAQLDLGAVARMDSFISTHALCPHDRSFALMHRCASCDRKPISETVSLERNLGSDAHKPSRKVEFSQESF